MFSGSEPNGPFGKICDHLVGFDRDTCVQMLVNMVSQANPFV
jgi:hypothetical protein